MIVEPVLINKKLIAIAQAEFQGPVLQFEDAQLAIDNPIVCHGKESLHDFIGAQVVGLHEETDVVFELHFEDDTKVSVSLLEEDYEGPEAMGLYGPNDLIVIWRFGEG